MIFRQFGKKYFFFQNNVNTNMMCGVTHTLCHGQHNELERNLKTPFENYYVLLFSSILFKEF